MFPQRNQNLSRILSEEKLSLDGDKNSSITIQIHVCNREPIWPCQGQRPNHKGQGKQE